MISCPHVCGHTILFIYSSHGCFSPLPSTLPTPTILHSTLLTPTQPPSREGLTRCRSVLVGTVVVHALPSLCLCLDALWTSSTLALSLRRRRTTCSSTTFTSNRLDSSSVCFDWSRLLPPATPLCVLGPWTSSIRTLLSLRHRPSLLHSFRTAPKPIRLDTSSVCLGWIHRCPLLPFSLPVTLDIPTFSSFTSFGTCFFYLCTQHLTDMS